MWLDVIAFGALVWLTLVGLWRGSLATGLRLGSLLVAYGSAVIGASVFGASTAETLNLPEFFGIAAAGLGSFVVAYLVAGIASRILIAYERGSRASKARSGVDRLGGGLLGATQGAIIVLLIGWLQLWIQAGQANGALNSLPAPTSSAAASVTRAVVEKGAEAVLDEEDTAGRMAVRVAVRPTETLEGVQNLIEGPHLSALQNDKLFWSYLEHGAVDAALNRASFMGLAYDADFRQELASLGLISEAAAADSKVFVGTVRPALRRIGPRIRSLREDPEFQGLVRDPEITTLLESGNTLQLLAHPKIRRVARRVLDEPESAEAPPASAASDF
jgi:hypothetical protein